MANIDALVNLVWLIEDTPNPQEVYEALGIGPADKPLPESTTSQYLAKLIPFIVSVESLPVLNSTKDGVYKVVGVIE
jgi:hypothetical protein